MGADGSDFDLGPRTAVPDQRCLKGTWRKKGKKKKKKIEGDVGRDVSNPHHTIPT